MVARAKWLPELKIEKKKPLKGRICRWTKWLLKNIWTVFLLWHFKNFSCLSHCLVISFNTWQYWKNVACHLHICSGDFTQVSELWPVGLLFTSGVISLCYIWVWLCIDFVKSNTLWNIFSSPGHEVIMVSYCGQSMSIVRRAASTIALNAYSSYTPGPIDLILGRKHQGDL